MGKLKEFLEKAKELKEKMNEQEAIIKAQVTVRKDYENMDLSDLVENTIDMALSVLKTDRQIEYTKLQWDYCVMFYNCCGDNPSHSASDISRDVRGQILKLHTQPEIQKTLESYGEEKYELATRIVIERKKEEILQFWDEYMEPAKPHT